MDPLPVWKVELVKGLAAHDVAGSLALEEEQLVFTARDGGIAPIAYGAIGRVQRLRLTAVIVVRWSVDGETRETAYYATKPPPLHQSNREEQELRAGLGRMFPTTKRMQARRNSTYLAEAGTTLKPVLKAWVLEIERRVADA